MATSLKNQAPERRTRAQASMSIDQPRYSIERIVGRSTKIVDRVTIRADVTLANSNALTTANKPIGVY
jgi:hypothetical protein